MLERGATLDDDHAPLVPADVGHVRFDPARALWLWGMMIPGVLVGVPAISTASVLASLALAFLTLCVGHSVGLHRGVIHHTYEASPPVRGALAWLFVLSGLGGPLSWARLHATRDHWQNQRDCPGYFAYRHSLAHDFVWNLHLRFEPADARADHKLPAGVLEDRWLRFLEASWPLHVLALALGVLAIGGADAVAVCVCARTAAGVLGHWFVGYAAHRWGSRPYPVAGASESGTNLWLLGVLSFGEGFHNNHHAHPHSARIGLARGQLDLGWLVIRAFEAVGLVRHVRAQPLPARADPVALDATAAAPTLAR
jgi:fatty-acid desaturase